MYLNPLMTDLELINAAQYAENPHLRLLAKRLDNKLWIIQQARSKIGEAHKIELSDDASDLICKLSDILES